MRTSIIVGGIGVVILLQLYTIISTRVLHEETMAQIDDLKDALTTISTEVDKVSADTDSLIAKLEALNTNPAVDLTEVLTLANSIKDRVTALDARVDDAPTETTTPVSSTDTPTA